MMCNVRRYMERFRQLIFCFYKGCVIAVFLYYYFTFVRRATGSVKTWNHIADACRITGSQGNELQNADRLGRSAPNARRSAREPVTVAGHATRTLRADHAAGRGRGREERWTQPGLRHVQR